MSGRRSARMGGMGSLRGSGGPGVPNVHIGASPLLASKTPPGRSRTVLALLGLAFAALLARAAWIQVIDNDYYRSKGDKRFVHRLPLEASRGRILDRDGELLAVSLPAPSIFAVPREFSAGTAQKRELARALDMTVAQLDRRLSGPPGFAWLERQAGDSTWARVQAMKLPGIAKMDEWRRSYPAGEAVAQVLGSTNIEGQGAGGIEYRFDSALAGHKGSRTVVMNNLHQIVEDAGDTVAAADGQDLRLSIDAQVQFFAYQRLRQALAESRAAAGTVVVLDAKSGEVLAMANAPSWRPGIDLPDPGDERMRNRALEPYEPGSTVKPFIVAAALDHGLVNPETVVDTAPPLVVDGFRMKTQDSHAHARLTVTEVIQKSSNLGAARLALRMPMQDQWKVYDGLGFGQRPPQEFAAAKSGELRPYRKWGHVDQATMAYGYGLSVSALQLARAYTAFANDGEVVPVTLLRQEPGWHPPAEAMQRVMSERAAGQVRHMLQLVASPGGTAPLAQTMGYSVGGKSGTSHKNRSRAQGGGYENSKYRAWFIGLAPIEAPRIVVAVMIDEPAPDKHFGGEIAAPVFSAVVQNTLRTLGVPPDLAVKPQISAEFVPESD